MDFQGGLISLITLGELPQGLQVMMSQNTDG